MSRIARIHVSLEEIEPKIWRRIEVPIGTSLYGLHKIIQAAMGWEESHLFQFETDHQMYGIPSPEWDREMADARKEKLAFLVERGVDRFGYVYDFGDNWQHVVTVEVVEPGDPKQVYPHFIDGARRCPPEDVGSVPGYYEFVEAIQRPRHPRHREMLKWYGRPMILTISIYL